jgi:hypothetical protein
MSIFGSKGCFPFVSLFDSDLIVGIYNIKLGKPIGSPDLILNFANQW